MRALLDTSVLIEGEEPPADIEAAISVVSLVELHFGVLVAANDERAARIQRLGTIESTFDPLPIGADVAREWGRLAAAVTNRGGQPRRRAIDLALAATANVHGVPLLTHNVGDYQIISDLIDARDPSALQPTESEPTKEFVPEPAKEPMSDEEREEPPAT
jgi:toxin FitB